MAAPLPASFKSADISRFALRAAQLEKFKPVIAYWCEYYIVNQILNKGLHTDSDESMTYTTNLMDKLERFKEEHAGNDAVHDDMAAQAIVEQFALDTFKRADNAVRANKATAQTADTFRAAATFLDLLGVWQTPLDKDIAAKSKYAKFHALRIAKALKAGEDPNLSNPEPETPASPPAQAVLSPSDPDVQLIEGLQPTVEDASDHSRPPSFVETHSPIIQPYRSQAPPQGDVSPLDASPNDGYFPNVPTFTSENTAPSLPTANPDVVMGDPPAAPVSPQDFYATPTQHQPPHHSIPPRAPSHPQMPPARTASTPQFQAPAPAHTATFAPPPNHQTRQGHENQGQQRMYQSPPSQTYQSPPPPQTYQPQPQSQPETLPGRFNTDDEAVMAAQKHAKWAISALNFEDVETAVKELRIALRALGAG